MEKAIIIGGSYRDIPLIDNLKKLGIFTITYGKGNYYIGHKFANKFYVEDYSNTKRLEEIIKQEKVNYIIPGCSEKAYIIAANLSNKLKLNFLDTKETIKNIFDKWNFKKLCKYLDINIPDGTNLLEVDLENIEFPILLKHKTLSGGKEVFLIKNKNELNKFLKNIKKEQFFVEQFIEGNLFAYTALISNCQIHFDFLARDIENKVYKFNVSTSYQVKDNKVKIKVRNYITSIIKRLNLKNGVIHCQFIKDNKENIYLIDITRRIPGDLFPYLIDYSTGYNFSKNVVLSYLNRPLENPQKLKQNNIIRHCVFAEKSGVLKNIFIPKQLEKDIIYRFDIIKKGEEIKDYRFDRIAILLIRANYINEEKINFIREQITVEVE